MVSNKLLDVVEWCYANLDKDTWNGQFCELDGYNYRATIILQGSHGTLPSEYVIGFKNHEDFVFFNLTWGDM